jgi:hypothetical protein
MMFKDGTKKHINIAGDIFIIYLSLGHISNNKYLPTLRWRACQRETYSVA